MFSLLFVWQGSLYELDKVGFTPTGHVSRADHIETIENEKETKISSISV